jgi:hypothetical protein
MSCVYRRVGFWLWHVRKSGTPALRAAQNRQSRLVLPKNLRRRRHLGAGAAHVGDRSRRPRRQGSRRAASHSLGGVRGSSAAFRPARTPSAATARGRLDQPASRPPQTGNSAARATLNSTSQCLKVVDTFRPLRTSTNPHTPPRGVKGYPGGPCQTSIAVASGLFFWPARAGLTHAHLAPDYLTNTARFVSLGCLDWTMLFER